MEELTQDPIPCPFCGHKHTVIQPGASYGWKRVTCRGCGASGPEQRTEQSAIIAWDTRVPP